MRNVELVGGQGGEHLVAQVVGHHPVVAAEAPRPPGAGRPGRRRPAREVQPGGPALGRGDDRGDVGGRQLEARRGGAPARPRRRSSPGRRRAARSRRPARAGDPCTAPARCGTRSRPSTARPRGRRASTAARGRPDHPARGRRRSPAPPAGVRPPTPRAGGPARRSHAAPAAPPPSGRRPAAAARPRATPGRSRPAGGRGRCHAARRRPRRTPLVVLGPLGQDGRLPVPGGRHHQRQRRGPGRRQAAHEPGAAHVRARRRRPALVEIDVRPGLGDAQAPGPRGGARAGRCRVDGHRADLPAASEGRQGRVPAFRGRGAPTARGCAITRSG